jgi:transcription initiation protein SPT3
MVRSLTLAALSVKKSLEDSMLLSTSSLPSSSPLKRKRADGDTGDAERDEDGDDDTGVVGCSLFLPPPEARGALRPEHIQDAFARMQGDWSRRRSAGMRNWRGGLIRTRVTLI